MRFVPGAAWVTAWQTTPSPGEQRMLAVEASQRASRYGRWHLAENQGVFNPVTSLPPQRVQAFWRAANAGARSLDAAAGTRYWDRILGGLALDQAWSVVTLPPPAEVPPGGPAPPREPLLALRVAATQSDAAMIRWHSRWRLIDPPAVVTAAALAARLQEVTAADADVATGPLVERIATPARHRGAADPTPQLQQNRFRGEGSDTNGKGTSGAGETPNIDARRLSASQWQILVDAPANGMLCIKQFQDGNWHATVRQVETDVEVVEVEVSGQGAAAARQQGRAAQRAVVHCCDFLFMAVPVPAGVSEIRLFYQPWWFSGSLLVAAIGLLTTCVLGTRSANDKRSGGMQAAQ